MLQKEADDIVYTAVKGYKKAVPKPKEEVKPKETAKEKADKEIKILEGDISIIK